MAGNAEISWPHLRMRIEDNASFAHGFRMLRYTGTFSRVKHFPLSLIQAEQDVSYWLKNVQLILVNCLREACPGTLWLSY